MRGLLLTLTLFSTALSPCAFSEKSDVPLPTISPTAHLDADADHLSVTKPEHFRPLLTSYLQSSLNTAHASQPVHAADLLSSLGINQLEAISFSNKLLGDTWINRAFLQNGGKNTGVFQLLDHSDTKLNSPFCAPVSTDIAAQFSLDLSHASALITALAQDYHAENSAAEWLDQTIVEHTLRQHMQGTHARLHLAIDFDDNDLMNLGRVEIGRPHVLLRIDGANSLIESTILHYQRSRGVPFIREENGKFINYRLPDFIKAATANILPFIQLDTENNTATLASTQEFFEHSLQPAQNITEDPQFQETWSGLPHSGSAMLYVSKRVLNSTEKLYNRAIAEEWTDNPTFLKNRPIYDQFIKDLNSSTTGLAFSISEKPNGQLISLKGPVPSALLAIILGSK